MTLTKITLATTLSLLAVQATAVAAPIVGDAVRGTEITSKWCVSCHYLNGQSGADGAPSLHSVAAKAAQTPSYLHNFLMAPHKPMPPLQLTNQEIEDVAAYLGGIAKSGK